VTSGHHKQERADWRDDGEADKINGTFGTLPVEHWEIDASIYGALADNVSACGLLCTLNMPVGTRLYVRISTPEYELDWITVEANIVSDRHITED
jgi:hypothetical protein